MKALLLALACAAARVAAARGDEPEALFRQGRDGAALAACDAADPARAELRVRCLVELNRLDEAATALAALPAAAGEEAATRRLALKARLDLARGALDEALRGAQELRQRAPGGPETALLSGLALLAAGKVAEGDKELGALPADGGGDLHLRRDLWRAAAQKARRARQWGEAAELYAKVAAESDGASACEQQAICHGFAFQYAAAIAAWEEALRRAPESKEIRLRLADLCRSQGRIDEAIAWYAPLAASEPPSPVALLRLAELAFEKGEVAVARGHAERAAQLAPASGDVAAIRARVAEKTGDAEGAIALYRQALERNPLRYDALYRLALLLARARDAAMSAEGEALLLRYRRIEPWLQEIEAARQELAAEPREAARHVRLAGVLNLAGEYALAKGFIERSERMGPPTPAALVQAGYVFANLGELPAARDRFARALARIDKVPAEAAAAAALRTWIAQIDRHEPLPLPLGTTIHADGH